MGNINSIITQTESEIAQLEIRAKSAPAKNLENIERLIHNLATINLERLRSALEFKYREFDIEIWTQDKNEVVQSIQNLIHPPSPQPSFWEKLANLFSCFLCLFCSSAKDDAV